jgi:hypothetical protein
MKSIEGKRMTRGDPMRGKSLCSLVLVVLACVIFPAAAAAIDLGYGPNLFYYFRHDPSLNNFSTFGTISTSGVITDRFGVGSNFDALTFVAKDLGYGPNLFYYLRHDPSLGNFSTFGTISTSGAITDRFGVGQNFDDLVFVEDNLGYGPDLFYTLRHDPSLGNFSTFGTISTSGVITDRFGVGQDFDALTFVAANLGYGPNLFYTLRHDPSLGNFSTFGTISTSGVITDRFGVGQNFDALTFAADNLGYGPNLFYTLRHDPSLGDFSTFGTIATSGIITDRFGVGRNFDALTFAVGPSTPPPTVVSIDIRPGEFPNNVNPRSKGKIPVAILATDIFDPSTVNPATVRFGRTGTEAPPVHSHLEDVNGDGRADLLLQFETQPTGIVCGDATASLTGQTASGGAIQGSDSIATVGCK